MSQNDIPLSVSQTARALGCSETVVRKWLRAGRLREVSSQGQAFIRLGDLRGMPKKRNFSERDIEIVARRMGMPVQAREKAAA